MREFWAMVWKDFNINRLFKIVLTIYSFKIVNLSISHTYYIETNLIMRNFIFFKYSHTCYLKSLKNFLTKTKLLPFTVRYERNKLTLANPVVIWKSMPHLAWIARACTYRRIKWKAALLRTKLAHLVAIRYIILQVVLKGVLNDF